MTDEIGMLERVARALCDDTMKRWRTPLALKNEPWREFIPAARAAIEAMRAPSKGLIEYGTTFGPNKGDRINALASWPEMINAILSEDQPSRG